MASNDIYITGIKNFKLKNFKSIQSIDIDLNEGLNILIGQNASGKSNFLNSLYLAMHLPVKRLPFFSAELNFFTSNNNVLVWEIEKNKQADNQFTLSSESQEVDSSKFQPSQKIIFNNELIYNSKTIRGDFLKYKNKNISVSSNVFRQILKLNNINDLRHRIITFNLPKQLDCVEHSSILKIIWDKTDRSLFEDFEIPESFSCVEDSLYRVLNAYAHKPNPTKKIVLSELKLNQKIKENLSKYSPIEDVRFHQNILIFTDERITTIENIQLEFKINGHWMSWNSLSDGTKRLFYIISETVTLTRGTLLLEEPELGTHPHQFHLLMDLLKEESKRKQIIISTHSPQALNILQETELDSIIVTKIDKKKGTKLSHLTAREKNKAIRYMNEVGFLSDYWLLSDLEK